MNCNSKCLFFYKLKQFLFTVAFQLFQVKNEVEELQRLVLLGVDVNAPNSDGSTALHVAATVGSRGVVQYLTDHRADINAVDSLGNTPLNVSTFCKFCKYKRG